MSNNTKQNKEVEKLIDALIKDVHYEKTYPAHTAYYQLDFEKLRKSLGSFIQAQKEKTRKETLETEIPKIQKELLKDYERDIEGAREKGFRRGQVDAMGYGRNRRKDKIGLRKRIKNKLKKQ